MKPLQHVEHRSVLIIEQATRNMNAEIGGDADEIFVERSVVDRAHAQPVAHERLARLLGVADDVRSVEQPNLAETADRATIVVCGKYGTAKLRLMDALLDLADDVAPLDLIGDVNRALLRKGTRLPRKSNPSASAA